MKLKMLKGFTYSEGEDGQVPTRVVLELTTDETLLLAKLVGATSHNQREEVMRGGGVVGSDIYDALAGDVFNRFWDAGIDGAMRERGAS